MYGMVNKAVEDLVCSQFGEDAWEQIKAKAGVDVDVFVSNEGYPDTMTYRLVVAASEVLNLPADQILNAFGEWWILKTAREGYGEMMEAGGKTLPEFLINLPNFHTRVTMVYPKLDPPKFEVTDLTERSLRLHYHTHRPGLSQFVVGLLKGLGKMFHTEATVTVLVTREQGADHDEFLVEW
jgi:hypothetical protein